MTDVIATRGLVKRFGRVTAVSGIDLRIPAGIRFGLLGPNGSGKTTLVRMLLGLVHATAGEVELLGEPMPRRAARVLPRVGALVEGPAAWADLSGRTNLRLIDAAGPGRGQGRRRRVDEALERVGLGGIDGRPVRAYSLGMRQRLGLAAALLRGPELLLLDEPTNGLDPRGIGEIRALLTAVNEAGTTVVLSSHLLGEVDALCHRVGVMDAGRLVLEEDLTALRAPTGRVLVRTADPAAAVAELDGRVVDRSGDHLVVRHDDPAALNARLVAAGIRVAELMPERRTLEQVVLDLTGHGADRMDADRVNADRARRAGPIVTAVELGLLVRRRRVWLCWALLCALPTLVAVLLAVTGLAPPPGRGGAFLSAVVSNGQLFPAAALALVLPVFLPITVAIVAGDAVAGEASAGTLRYLLVRPVGRLRLLVAKLVSVTVFVLLAVLFVTVTGYVVGVALFGFGPDAELGGAGGVTSLSGAVLSPAELLGRTALVVGYLALCMLALGAVGLFFSTLTDSPLAAALGVLALVVASAALQPLDAAGAIEPYLPTAHWLAWIDLYRDPILWSAVREGAAVQAGYVLVAFGAAWANFATKDVTI